MEWFAVTSAVTTSLAWAGADARARGAWVSLADVCRQTMTDGRIRDARSQLTRVCRLARVGAGDLRAVINAGLVVYDGDDLVLTGWDHGKEREAASAALRARNSRQRQQRQQLLDDEAPTSDEAAELPESVREPFANATPHATPNADPNFGTEERRGDKTREETPPPSPQGAEDADSRTRGGRIAATAATAQGHLSDTVREPYANTTPNELGVGPGTVRPAFANAPPHATPNAKLTVSGESPEISTNRPQHLAPKRSPRDALPALRAAALSDHALGIVTALGVCLRGPGGADYTAEWQRELSGIDAREVLAMCLTAREPIRLPSGLRREREAWRQLPIEERRSIVHQVCASHSIPAERRPSSTDPPP